ncbi:hypothetical protein NP233_g2385 [Leucocoprinus birnbaumii]|uniref:F-box domain-containing protein n=1 Tax=Leucocoprinus birnbaumii TaxID=56174 RepID=A0AAD5W4L4_9AGAR|nr:hypothetical protein NP233_g2385 [Leucocoprinus birnbaumii]
MHPCLCISEILELICQEFSQDPDLLWNINNGKALVSLACTSRSWSEPALQVLWYRVQGIDKLFRSLAKDLWEKFNDEDPLVLKRPLSTSDMRIFDKNAARIRVFVERNDQNVTLYRALYARGYSCVLPRLEALSWQIEIPDLFPYLRLLIPPSLRKLDAFFGDQSLVIEQLNLLGAIPLTFPLGITNLSLGTEKDYPDTIFPGCDSARKAFVDVLRSWSNVTDLELDEVPLESLGCIVNMPSLKQLVFRTESDPVDPPHREPDFGPLPWKGKPEPPCPFLQAITISQTPVSTIHVMFKALVHLQLRYLSLGLGRTKNNTLSGTEALLDELNRLIDPHTLEDISISSRFGFQRSSLVAPLLRFRKLKKVRLDAYPLDFTSDIPMSEVASSWPLLESMYIVSSTSANPETSRNLLSLIPLAKECQQLHTLFFRLNASDPAVWRIIQDNPNVTEGVQNWSLKRLQIQQSPISDSKLVVSFLSKLFPALERVDWTSYGREVVESHQRRWERVDRMLGKMKRERELRTPRDSTRGWRMLSSG